MTRRQVNNVFLRQNAKGKITARMYVYGKIRFMEEFSSWRKAVKWAKEHDQ